MTRQFDPAPMSKLLCEGSNSYLDALYALHRYRLAVTDRAIAVLTNRLAKLTEVMNVEENASLAVEAYYNPNEVGRNEVKNRWNGNWAWLAAKATFTRPTNGFVYFGLTFDRNENGIAAPANVTIAYCPTFGSGAHYGSFQELSAALRAQNQEGYYWDDESAKECGFSRPLRDSVSIEDEFAEMMGYFIAVWIRIGRLDPIPTL